MKPNQSIEVKRATISSREYASHSFGRTVTYEDIVNYRNAAPSIPSYISTPNMIRHTTDHEPASYQEVHRSY
jgi:hypothetical protein